MKIRINLYTICLLFAMLLVSGYAQAQEPNAGAGKANVTPAGTEFRLSDFLARVARGSRRHTAEARSGFLPASSGSAKASGPFFNITPAAATGASLPVTGSGTLGRLTKWAGFTSSNSVIGDTTIFEDKYGNVGVGTDSPTSRFTVVGLIHSLSGGFKFPDGTVQTTAASNNALTTVVHDVTLIGNGTGGSPLGVAVPLSLLGSSNNPIIVGDNRGGGVGVQGLGGTGLLGAGSIGVAGQGDAVSGFVTGGSGVVASGGEAPDGFGGPGSLSTGGNGLAGGTGVRAFGGDSTVTQGAGSGGAGLRTEGGIGRGQNVSGGEGIVAIGGAGLNGATKGLAGRFQGDVDITGNLSKGGGSFKIDHPLDPENKYLYHSFVESPDMMNIYNGNVTTDEHGEVVVTLPDWFEALNKDFRYQLTVIGTFAQAIVADKIKGNRFTIKTSASNVEVSWQVTGIRQDAYANKHRVKVEEDKESERGYYLHPEAFDQPDEKGIEWARHSEMMRQLKRRRQQAELRVQQNSGRQ